MIAQKATSRVSVLVVISIFLLTSTIAFAAGKQADHSPASAAASTSGVVSAGTPPPLPPHLTTVHSPTQAAVLASTLSYYFISGNTFTPDAGSMPYYRQVTGCVNQTPLNWSMSAPIHLPQNSQVVSITLYAYDSAITTTFSTAYFILNDGKGMGGYTVSASSSENSMGYQQINSTQNNPTTIDNQNYNYYIQWYKSGMDDSPYLSLCGVRVAYYAPVGATYLPAILK